MTEKNLIVDMIQIADELKSNNDDVVETQDPQPGDAGWTQWVLSHLEDNELSDGAPATDGIRRVCNELYGSIISSISDVVYYGEEAVAVKHTVSVLRNGQIYTASAAVDALRARTPEPFKSHLLATADTKAEGKALRRLMKIRVITKEEQQVENDLEISNNSNINDNQIIAIEGMAGRLKINIKNLLKYLFNDVESIRDLTGTQAQQAISTLSGYQRDIDNIPTAVKG